MSWGRLGPFPSPDLAQRTATSEHDTFWGNDPSYKPSRTLRIGFLNINTFPTTPLHSKNTLLRTHITDHKIDIMCLEELNTQWTLIHPDERLKERVLPWWSHSATTVSFNSINTRSSFQPGGTDIICIEQEVSHLFSRGEEPTNLGRWSYNF